MPGKKTASQFSIGTSNASGTLWQRSPSYTPITIRSRIKQNLDREVSRVRNEFIVKKIAEKILDFRKRNRFENRQEWVKELNDRGVKIGYFKYGRIETGKEIKKPAWDVYEQLRTALGLNLTLLHGEIETVRLHMATAALSLMAKERIRLIDGSRSKVEFDNKQQGLINYLSEKITPSDYDLTSESSWDRWLRKEKEDVEIHLQARGWSGLSASDASIHCTVSADFLVWVGDWTAVQPIVHAALMVIPAEFRESTAGESTAFLKNVECSGPTADDSPGSGVSASQEKQPTDSGKSAYTLPITGHSKQASDLSSSKLIDFSIVLEAHHHFTGRQWLFDKIEKRLRGPERALLVAADPGVGKTAFIAEFVRRNPNGEVLAYHFCQAENPDTLEPGLFVQNLATMIASRLDPYSSCFKDPAVQKSLSDVGCASNPVGAFESAIIVPLRKLSLPAEEIRYVLIDALDEALVLQDRRLNIVELLAFRLEQFPPWLRLIGTTRKNPSVLRRFRPLCPQVRLDSDDPYNRADLGDFIANRLTTSNLAKKISTSQIPVAEVQRQLCSAGEGNFLYVVQALHDIEVGNYGLNSLSELPQGLKGIYDAYMQRQFPTSSSYELPRRVLEVILSAGQPLTFAQLANATCIDADYALPEVLRQLGHFLPIRDEKYTFYHRSLVDWLSDRDGPFHASTRRGHLHLAEMCWAEYEGPVEALSVYALQYMLLHLSKCDMHERLARALADHVYLIASGDHFYRTGDTTRAREHFDRLVQVCQRRVEQDPHNPLCQHWLSFGHERLGDVLASQGDEAGALTAYWTAEDIRKWLVARDSNNFEWQGHLSIVQDRIGDLLRMQGDTAGALAAHQSALAIAEHLAAQNPKNISLQHNLSVSRGKLGDMLRIQGDTAGALAAYRTAQQIREHLVAQDPSNAVWQRDLSASRNNLGDVLQAQGDVAGARVEYKAAQQIRERLVAQHPSNLDWQHDLSMSHIKVGDVLRTQGDGAGTLLAYRAALHIDEHLVERDPRNTEVLGSLSTSHIKLGDVLRTQGDTGGALNEYRAAQRIRERLVGQDSSNAVWQSNLSVSQTRIGMILEMHGDLAGALNAYRTALQINKHLVERDPHNTFWQSDLAIHYNQIGYALWTQGDEVGAMDAYQAANTIVESLIAQDPSNADWQRELSVSQERMATVLWAQGDTSGALAMHRSALEISEHLVAQDPSNTVLQDDLAVSHNKLGDMMRDQDDKTGALAAYRAAMQIRDHLVARDPNNTNWPRDLSVSHDRIGDVLKRQGDKEGALNAYRTAHGIRERLVAQDPRNAGWQRDLWISYWRIASIMEEHGNPDAAYWWRRAYEKLSSMKNSGNVLSPGDEGFLGELQNKCNTSDE